MTAIIAEVLSANNLFRKLSWFDVLFRNRVQRFLNAALQSSAFKEWIVWVSFYFKTVIFLPWKLQDPNSVSCSVSLIHGCWCSEGEPGVTYPGTVGRVRTESTRQLYPVVVLMIPCNTQPYCSSSINFFLTSIFRPCLQCVLSRWSLLSKCRSQN